MVSQRQQRIRRKLLIAAAIGAAIPAAVWGLELTFVGQGLAARLGAVWASLLVHACLFPLCLLLGLSERERETSGLISAVYVLALSISVVARDTCRSSWLDAAGIVILIFLVPLFVLLLAGLLWYPAYLLLCLGNVVGRACSRPAAPEQALACPECGYPLIGLTSKVCPECGNYFTYAALGTTKEELCRAADSAAAKRPDE